MIMPCFCTHTGVTDDPDPCALSTYIHVYVHAGFKGKVAALKFTDKKGVVCSANRPVWVKVRPSLHPSLCPSVHPCMANRRGYALVGGLITINATLTNQPRQHTLTHSLRSRTSSRATLSSARSRRPKTGARPGRRRATMTVDDDGWWMIR